MKNFNCPFKCATIAVALFLAYNSGVNAQSSNYKIAPQEYAAIAEKALNHLTKLDIDAWGKMLADNVEYTFPDGDIDTRTKLVGKKAVMEWWTNYKNTSGIESMTAEEVNLIPLTATGAMKGGANSGTYVFSYFSNKMVFKTGSTAVRMNFVAHFNDAKQIDRYVTYYDRTPIIKVSGKNFLERK